MLENNSLPGRQALALVREHLPQVLAATGRQPADWQQALLLSRLARHQFQQYYFNGAAPAPPEAGVVVMALHRLEARLQDPARRTDWPLTQTQLRRIMPLVERLLAA